MKHVATGMLLMAALFSCSPRPAIDANAADNKLGGGYRFERNGWIYVHLEGAPETLGYQHGYLLADEIRELLRVVGPFLEHTTKKSWTFYREAAQSVLWPKIEEEYRRELDGIVEGLTARNVKADRWDIVALNAIEELPGYYVPWLDKLNGKAPATQAPGNCSAFIATGTYTKDGRIVMGHNAWTDYVVGTRWNIMFDLEPKNGARLLMDGLPGIIVSDDDFTVNSAGIMVTETTITGFEGFDPNGKPEFVRARKAMQYSKSIEDFAAIFLDGNNGGYANDWLIGDNHSGEIALFETGLKNHSLRRTKDGYFVGSNFPVDDKLRTEETHFDVTNKRNSANARRARWGQLMETNRGKIDAEVGKQMEADNYDVIDKKTASDERSLCGAVDQSPRGVPEWDWGRFFPGGTVQAKVIDGNMADKMQMWAAMGRPCGPDFVSDHFLAEHKEYEWARGLLRDLRTQPWTNFSAGMHGQRQ